MAKKLTLDLDIKLKTLANADSDALIGQTIAQLMAYDAKSDDPIKVYGWAETLYAKDALVLDESDFKKFKEVVKSLSDKLTISFQAQLARILDAAELAANEAEKAAKAEKAAAKAE